MWLTFASSNRSSHLQSKEEATVSLITCMTENDVHREATHGLKMPWHESLFASLRQRTTAQHKILSARFIQPSLVLLKSTMHRTRSEIKQEYGEQKYNHSPKLAQRKKRVSIFNTWTPILSTGFRFSIQELQFSTQPGQQTLMIHSHILEISFSSTNVDYDHLSKPTLKVQNIIYKCFDKERGRQIWAAYIVK